MSIQRGEHGDRVRLVFDQNSGTAIRDSGSCAKGYLMSQDFIVRAIGDTKRSSKDLDSIGITSKLNLGKEYQCQ